MAIRALKQFFKTDCFTFTNVSEQKSFYSWLITVPDFSRGGVTSFKKLELSKTQICRLAPLCFVNYVLLKFFSFSSS